MADPAPIELFSPEGMYRPAGYHHAARAGDTIYVAGQVARDEAGAIVAPHDAAGQARAVFANLARVLAAAGSDPRHVVKLTTFLVDPADAAAVAAARRELFGEHRPPHTGLIVVALGDPAIRVEVEAIAVVAAAPDVAS
jgi:2-iminobutanoate/2-iminopropanoate deaminase